MADKQVSVRISAQGGKEMKAELITIGKEGKKAFSDIGNASGAIKGSLQNTAYQVQDVFVQVAGGTSVSRALAQQLPQLLSGFGLMGVLAGTAAAALIPLINSLFETGQSAEDVKKSVDNLVSSIGELKKANDVYSTKGVEQLIDKYGKLDAAVLRLVERKRAAAAQDAADSATAAKESLGGVVSGITEVLKEYDGVSQLIANSNYGDVQAQQQGALLTVTQQLNEEYGITLERARDIQAAFDQLSAAKTPSEMAAALALIQDLLQGSTLLTKEMRDKLLDAEDALQQLNAQGEGVNSWLDAAISGTSTWAANLWEAAKAGAAARAAAATKASMDTGNADWAKNSLGFTLPGSELIYTPPKTSSGSGTSSGRSGGGGGQSDDMRRVKQLFEQTRTEAEKFKTEQAEINDLFAKGKIDADLFHRSMDMIGKKYGEASDMGKYFNGVTTDLKEGFLDLATTGEASFDKIAKSIERAIIQAAIFGDGPLGDLFGGGLMGLIGGGGGDLFANIGGARAGGGSVFANRSYLVGENGPELFAPHNAGIIHKAGSFARGFGGGGGSGTSVQIIDQRSGGQPIQTETKTGPDGREMIIMTVRDATGRGELDTAQRRFGAKPVGVKR